MTSLQSAQTTQVFICAILFFCLLVRRVLHRRGLDPVSKLKHILCCPKLCVFRKSVCDGRSVILPDTSRDRRHSDATRRRTNTHTHVVPHNLVLSVGKEHSRPHWVLHTHSNTSSTHRCCHKHTRIQMETKLRFFSCKVKLIKHTVSAEGPFKHRDKVQVAE